MNRKSRLSFLPFAALAFGLSTLSSCESDIPEVDKQHVVIETTMEESDAEESFARILSMAVSKDAALRQFLKAEAEKQFDKDYDVFYPYVKDAVVEDGRTFRDVLLSYTSEEELSTLENILPLLTIMIPDLSAFDAFSVHEWDPKDDQIAVTYAKGNDSSVFYSEGEPVLSLSEGYLPSFPFLVVKSNERMKILHKLGGTRAGQSVSYQYDFVNPAFDGSKTASTRARYYEENNTELAPEEKPYLKKEAVDPSCVEAYNLNKKNGSLIDREYVYYGLSPEHSQHGSYNLNIREKLFMFRIAVNQPVYVVDGENKNSVLKENVSYKSERPSTEQVVKELWTNGYFELVIYVYAGTGGGEEKVLSVSGQDLFYISKLKVRHQHSTVFRHNKWWYSTRVEDLKGKWVDVSKRDMWLNKLWDLSYLPENFFIKVVGGSNGSKQQMSETYIANYVCKLTEDGAIDHIVYDNPTNLGFSKQIASMKKCTNSYMCVSREDDLGGAIFNFTDPIIVSDKEADSKGYEMHALNTGAVELVIAPVRIR